MKRLFSVFFAAILVLVPFGHVFGEATASNKTENNELLPPDPNNLCPGWWNYFEQKNQAERIKDFIESLKLSTELLNGPARDKADYYLERINTNFESYLQAIALKAPILPATTPIAASYSLDHILEVYRSIRKKELELKGYSEERIEKHKQMDSAQDYVDRLTITYSKVENRSEDKFLVGLEIINYQASLEAAKKHIAYLHLVIDDETKQLEEAKEELNKATHRITVNHLDLRRLGREVLAAEEEWKQWKKERETKTSEVTAEVEKNDLAEAKHQAFQQEQLLYLLKETTAHSDFIKAQILFSLARIINEPKSADPATLKTNASEWMAIVQSQKDKLEEWTEGVRKLFLRYSKVVTMGTGTASTQEANELKELQQNVIQQARSNFMLIQHLGNNLDDSSFVLQELDHKTTHLMGGGERWLSDIMDFSGKSLNQANEWLNTPLLHINDNPITIYSLLKFVIIMILAVWVSRFLAKALTTFAMTRQGIHKSLVYRITRLIQYLVLSLGLIVALSAIGFDFSNLLLVAGALGVGLGFGLQSIFNNFISGIIILFESHLKVGDIIELDKGVKGEVREINVRSTIISTGDGSDIIIPNSEIITDKVTNWTLRDPYRKVHIPFTVAYGTDKEFVKKIVIEEALNIERTLDRPGVAKPAVNLIKLADYGLEFELSVWVDEKSASNIKATTSDYLWAIDEALEKNRVEVPFPKMEILLKNEGEEKKMSHVSEKVDSPLVN